MHGEINRKSKASGDETKLKNCDFLLKKEWRWNKTCNTTDSDWPMSEKYTWNYLRFWNFNYLDMSH